MTTAEIAPRELDPAPVRRRSPGPRAAGARAVTLPPLRGLLPLVVLLTAWEALGTGDSPYFPPPSRWAQGLVALWESGALVPAVGQTLGTLSVALGLATVTGVAGGLLLGVSPTADRALDPTLEFLRSMPPAAIVPIAALLLGYDETMKVVVVTLSATWAVLLNTRAGIRRLDPTMLDVARSLNLSPLDRLGKVIVPALVPSIFLGVRVAAPVAVVITLLVEILTQMEGLGALIGHAQRTYQSAQVYGLILVAGLFSLLVVGLVLAIEGYLLRHRPGR